MCSKYFTFSISKGFANCENTEQAYILTSLQYLHCHKLSHNKGFTQLYIMKKGQIKYLAWAVMKPIKKITFSL